MRFAVSLRCTPYLQGSGLSGTRFVNTANRHRGVYNNDQNLNVVQRLNVPRRFSTYGDENVVRSRFSTEITKETRSLARTRLRASGYEPDSFFEQPIVWGDHDAFQHVNNVRYVRFFESGRIMWLSSLAHEIGGQEKVDAMLKAKGISLILKSIEVKFKRPVTFPDTLLIAHKAAPANSSEHSTTQFKILAAAYSYSQRGVVAESEAVLVWYDYDRLRKCEPGDNAWDVLRRRMQASERQIQDGDSEGSSASPVV